jgi:hypothetical protein
MEKYVFTSENGDDKNDGLTENKPVRTVARALKISFKTGRPIKVLDYPDAPASRPAPEDWLLAPGY